MLAIVMMTMMTIEDIDDNCHLVANPNQENADDDDLGDACDSDDDNDGLCRQY